MQVAGSSIVMAVLAVVIGIAAAPATASAPTPDDEVEGGKVGRSTLIDRLPDGSSARGPSRQPDVSDDGRAVVLTSRDELTAADGEGRRPSPDVYLHDRDSGGTTLVSHALDGGPADRGSSGPRVSGDGQVVAFVSGASDLVEDDPNPDLDLFLWARETGDIRLLSRSAEGGGADGPTSGRPDLSRDGSLVTFHSDASNLVPDDTNAFTDIFLWDAATGTSELLSVGRDGAPANGPSRNPVLSGDDRFVAFESEATNLVAGTPGGSSVFLLDRQDGSLRRLGVGRAPSINGDGTVVAYENDASGFVMLWQDNADTFEIGFFDSTQPSVSADGNRVTLSWQSGSRYSEVLVFDRTRSMHFLVSRDWRRHYAQAWSDGSAISADGRTAVFSSDARDLVRPRTRGTHVFSSPLPRVFAWPAPG